VVQVQKHACRAARRTHFAQLVSTAADQAFIKQGGSTFQRLRLLLLLLLLLTQHLDEFVERLFIRLAWLSLAANFFN